MIRHRNIGNKFILSSGGSSYGIPKTGQVVSYLSDDDGDLQEGKPATGDRFTDNGDNTITDNATGLMWIKNVMTIGGIWITDYGSGDEPTLFTWDDAVSNSAALSHAGKTDWRLPNIFELVTTLFSVGEDMTFSSFFPDIQLSTGGSYKIWSSSTNLYGGLGAYKMYLDLDSSRVPINSANSSDTYLVKPVRTIA